MDTLYDVGSPSSLRAVSFVIRRRNWKKRSILFKPAVADHDLGVEGAAAAAPSSTVESRFSEVFGQQKKLH